MSATCTEGSIDDIDRLMAVMVRAFDPAFGEAWSRGQCLGILSLPDVWLILAREEDRVIGFALGRMLVDEVELLLLAVEPEARGHGVGSALIEHMAARAADRGVSRLLLEMRAGNPVETLYREAGFVQIGHRRDYYRGGAGTLFDALTLARPIAGAALPSPPQSQ